MQSFEYSITDDLGIHARPAGMLVRLAMNYKSEQTIARKDNSAPVSLKRIFTVMGLGVKCGDSVIISAEGEDEEQAINALQDFFRQSL
ncbi:PTS galactitol transporter subunit IIC [Izhakiella australiensis]|uniref:Phosphocarrier protein NPr n=1 Tax=Izhakiella australiensis TaxID=1926881 RepID=A0A1S8YKQ0_9GAMM|nr:HPr family phosphocarrier protein [Izhakiella australiensis]OON39604.1 PTS galactitol transporter subunit IIC [Izhakiella australiensis]